MGAELKKEIQLEIAHVLFIDIVGYSKLSINEQHAAVDELTQIVRATDQFQKADASERLIKIATGDGMALVFYTSSEAPVRCAIEVSRALKDHPRLGVRLGIHSGPVSGVVDVTGQANLTGAGLNLAHRVMSCGDAGHILLSKHVAEDLEEYDEWRPRLHDLGTCEVKHGVRIGIANLYDSEVGNPQLPKKLQAIKKHRTRVRWAEIAVALLMLAAIVAAFVFLLRRPTRSALAIPEKSVAVLPFENLSADPENAFFTDGVQDQVLNNLAKIADLKVMSRTSVMRYKTGVKRNLRQIANELGVAHVVEGSVQRAANRVSVSAQLIDAKTDRHMWVERYDRPLDDVFAIQSDIAKAIADQLQAKLSPREKAAIEERPTSDLAAYDLYLRAKELIYDGRINLSRQREDFFEAVRLLDQAITRDPAFLLAHCQLASINCNIYWFNYDHTETRLALTEARLRAASRLQPDAGETHLAQAAHFYYSSRNYDQARKELANAQWALPNNAEIFQLLGSIDRRQGRCNEAIWNFERSVDLDPRNASNMIDVGYTYLKLRRYEEAITMTNRALALEPRSGLLRAGRAWGGFNARSDQTSLPSALNKIEAEGASSAAEVSELSFQLALCERDVTAATRALGNISSEGYIDFDGFPFPHAWYEGLVAKLRQDAAAAS